MLTALPEEITLIILQLLEASDVVCLSASGDRLLRYRLGKCTSLRIEAYDDFWPSHILQLMPSLLLFSFKYHPASLLGATCNIYPKDLPQMLTSLTLPTLAKLDVPLSSLCPHLQSITVGRLKSHQIIALIPLPKGLRHLKATKDESRSRVASIDARILSDLPPSLESIHIETNITIVDDCPIEFPALSCLRLRIETSFIEPFIGWLPLSLQQLELELYPTGTVNNCEDFWNLIPANVTNLSIFCTSPPLDMPFPEQLNPLLEHLRIELQDCDFPYDIPLPRNLEDYWKALPRLKTFVVDESSTLDLEHLPIGMEEMPMISDSNVPPSLQLLAGSSLTKLRICAANVSPPEFQFSLPPALMELYILPDEHIIYSTMCFSSFPNSIEVLECPQTAFHPDLQKFPPKLSKLVTFFYAFPPHLGLQDLPLNTLTHLSFAAHPNPTGSRPVPPYKSVIERESATKFPIMPNLKELDLFYPSLTESYADFVKSISPSMPLIRVSMTTGAQMENATSSHHYNKFTGKNSPSNKPSKYPSLSICPNWPKTLKSLSQQVNKFDVDSLALLPRNLRNLEIIPLDSSLTSSLRCEHLKMLPRKLHSILIRGTFLNLKEEDWDAAGLPHLRKSLLLSN